MEDAKNLDFKTGDTVKVFVKDIAESKAHATPFEGTDIAIRGQNGSRTFTVRKVASAQVAVERIFPVGSPSIEKIQILKKSERTRSKLYFLRKKDASGKSRS